MCTFTCQTHIFNPPSGGLPGAAPGPQGVFFSTSGAIGTPKNSKKTDNIPRNEFLCRIFYMRVTEALSWRYLNKNAGQSWKSWVLLYFKKQFLVILGFRDQKFFVGAGNFSWGTLSYLKNAGKSELRVRSLGRKSDFLARGTILRRPLRPRAFF